MPTGFANTMRAGAFPRRFHLGFQALGMGLGTLLRERGVRRASSSATITAAIRARSKVR